MSMVVLYREKLGSLSFRTLPRVAGSDIIRVQVVDDNLRPDAEELLVEGDVLLKSAEGLVVVEVAHVMAEERLPIAPQGEGRLEMPAHSQQRPGTRQRQLDRPGSIAP